MSNKTILIDYHTLLGSGGYAVVYKGWLIDNLTSPNKRARNGTFTYSFTASDLTSDHAIAVAIKRLQLVQINNEDREGMALRMLDHRNVVKLLHVQSDDNFKYVM